MYKMHFKSKLPTEIRNMPNPPHVFSPKWVCIFFSKTHDSIPIASWRICHRLLLPVAFQEYLSGTILTLIILQDLVDNMFLIWRPINTNVNHFAEQTSPSVFRPDAFLQTPSKVQIPKTPLSVYLCKTEHLGKWCPCLLWTRGLWQSLLSTQHNLKRKT